LDYNKAMMITLLLFSFLAIADDMASEKYCFPSVSQGQAARHKLAGILVPSDIVTTDENCLVIQMRPHRRELIQRFILSSFPGTSVAFSSEDQRRESCQLKVEKEGVKTSQKTTFGVNQGLTIGQNNSSGSTTETMQIKTLKDFVLTVDQDEIKGSCRYLNPNRYEITIEVRKNPRPTIPEGLPQGSIDVLNQPPPDQETMFLKTQLQLSRGERIEIGGILKGLKKNNHQGSIKPSIKIEAQQGSRSEKVFLSLQ
jgi:hypothetical protein